MTLKIAILEDNADRRAAMEMRLADRFPQYPRFYFVAAQPMIEWLAEQIDEVILISLDHDLDLLPGEDGRLIDSGTGRDVADFLATHAPSSPIVLHTTNQPAAAGMEMVLEDAGWHVQRVVPYGDLEWIDEAWFPAIRNQIVESAIAVAGNRLAVAALSPIPAVDAVPWTPAITDTSR